MSAANSNWLRIGLYGTIHLLQLFAALFVLGGIADQARYGSANVCILFVEDYMPDKADPSFYLFSANSAACSAVVSLSAIVVAITFLIGVTSMTYIILAKFRSVQLIFGTMALSGLCTLLTFIMSTVAAVGIAQTCNQFRSSGYSCNTIFSGGFFETDSQRTYVKSVNIINASVYMGFANTIIWAAYTGLEYLNWKNSV